MRPRCWCLISFNQLNCNFGSVATGPQPHQRPPLGRRRQPWPGRLQAASGHGRKPANGLRRVTVFPVRAADRTILPVVWRDPGIWRNVPMATSGYMSLTR